MLVTDQVGDQPVSRVLGGCIGIGHTGHVPQQLFTVGGGPDKINGQLRNHVHYYQRILHIYGVILCRRL
jgi:hypothetical protein